MKPYSLYFQLLAFSLLVLASSGCGAIKRNTIGLFSDENVASENKGASSGSLDNQPSNVPVELPPTDSNVTAQDVEIIWQAPSSTVDGFVIHYGFSKEELSFERRINAADLKLLDHPAYGPVYRYSISDLPNDRTVYVSVSAFKDTLVSDPSEIFAVAPEEPK